MANYLTQNRHGTFYFRFVIPVQYRSHFKHKREIRYSLKTDSKKIALPKSRIYRVYFDRIIERLEPMARKDNKTYRTGLMTHSSIFGAETEVDYDGDKEKELEAVHELNEKDIKRAMDMGISPKEIIKLASASRAANVTNVPPSSIESNSTETWEAYSALYVSELLEAERIREGTAVEYQVSYKLLSDFAGGETKLVDFDVEFLTEFYKSLSDKAINTRSKHLTRISSVFKWALQRKAIAVNPVEGIMTLKDDRRDKDKRDMFDRDDLVKIFESEYYAKNQWRKRRFKVRTPYTFWMFPLALYTGARMSELLTVRTENIHTDVEVPYIDLLNEIDPDTGKEIKTLKNSNSIRKIPIADPLIEMGFIDLVKASRNAYLFPDIAEKETTTKAGQKLLSERLKMFGVWVKGEKSFHSLRHTFINTAASSGVDFKYLSAVTGHLSKKEMEQQQLYREMVGTYFKGFPVEKLKEEVIDKLEFDVDYSGVRWPIKR